MRDLPISFRRSRSCESSQPLISTFFSCSSCGNKRKMSSIPMGHHAAFKIRQQMNSNESPNGKQGASQSFSTKMTPTTTANDGCPDNPNKYSSKAMMAIWGLYNRYSVHNIKSNINSYDQA